MDATPIECEQETSDQYSSNDEGDVFKKHPLLQSPLSISASETPCETNVKSPLVSPENLACSEVEVIPLFKENDEKSPEKTKRVVRKELFSASKKRKVADLTEVSLSKGKSKCEIVVFIAPSFAASALPLLSVSQISDSKLRFAFEGKVFNKYGTFNADKDKKYTKYLKADLIDKEGLNTITLVVEQSYVLKLIDKLQPGNYVRIEGANVTPRNANDGGSAPYALHVDATTSLIKGEPFDVTLVFFSLTSIQNLFLKARHKIGLKATIAFVIIQIDKAIRSDGELLDQLTIADGPTLMDKATLSFVGGKKSVYHDLVEEFQNSSLVMYVARNIGVWKERSNTLSILDMTLLTPVLSDKTRKSLKHAFEMQISDMGYGKEVSGNLTITNFNDTLIVKKCLDCKSTKVNIVAEGGYCFTCGKFVDVLEVSSLKGVVTLANAEETYVTLTGGTVDRVLQLEDTFLNLYSKSVILTRVALSEFSRVGVYLIDNHGELIAYREPLSILK